jgi:RNA polymerase sigma-70 factor (ECF subfamily)
MLMIAPYTEKVLVVHLRQGDQKAFQHLYGSYRRSLFGVINTIVNDSNEAEDLLQDTFVKIWQRFYRYDPEKGTLFNWMLNVARNTALDTVRRRRLVQYTPYIEPDTLPEILTYLPVIDGIGVAYLARQTLLPHQWKVIHLAYWQGYSYPEIATQLALPLGTVKSHVRQSLIRLRPLFNTKYGQALRE